MKDYMYKITNDNKALEDESSYMFHISRARDVAWYPMG